jgi:hypothetical protein
LNKIMTTLRFTRNNIRGVGVDPRIRYH